MTTRWQRLRADPGLAFAIAAAVLAVLLYLPTLRHGIVNYDDPWLLADNWILQTPSWASIRIVLFDLHSPLRFVLTPEYLPVRDLSVMGDFALFGRWWPGFHLVAVLLYASACGLWFSALARFGIERRIAGLAILIWVVQPSHAESVAWLSERKGLLAVAFAGLCAIGYARWRTGGARRWLAVAVLAAVCAVWSKAHGAFAVASIAGLELVLPHGRQSWRRSMAGLAAIAVAAGAAFVPVLALAASSNVVGDHVALPVSRAELVLGVHGFYLRSFAMLVRNAVTYPIASVGPSALDLVLGATGFLAIIGVFVARARASRGVLAAPSPLDIIAAGLVLWLAGWLPIGHLVLPLQMVLVADRYLLFPSLGLALVLAVGLARVDKPGVRRLAIAALAIAGIARTLDAETNWRDARSLWERAVASNPSDPNAWTMYVETLEDQSTDPAELDRVLAEALGHGRAPRLVMHEALIALRTDRARGLALLREAATGGEGQAMSNLALLLLEDGRGAEALTWAQAGAARRPMYAHAQRTLGKVALAVGDPAALATAYAAFTRALEVEPRSCGNRLNVGLSLTALHRPAEAVPYFAACISDPVLGERARFELARAEAAKARAVLEQLAPR